MFGVIFFRFKGAWELIFLGANIKDTIVEIPPKLVRRLKGLIFVCINAMLEGRSDLVVHKPVTLWLDTRVLKERIVEHTVKCLG